jgi:transmembrane sensor
VAVNRQTKIPEPDQARIDQEAAEWLMRRSEGPLAHDEETQFERWLRSHPRHNLTFAAMSGVWAHAGGLKHLAHLAESQPRAKVREILRRTLTLHPWLSGSIATLTAAAAAVVIFGALYSTSLQSTGLGETRTVTLPDGSSVFLGARSQIRVNYSDTERRVQLTSGEALFEVKHDPGRPFVVDAGDELVRDVGTRFDINRSDTSVRVYVLQGAVEIRDNHATPAETVPAPVQVLNAGDGMEATHRPASGRQPDNVTYAKSSHSRPDAWRTGWLVYENASLGDVVADVNRYYGPGVDLGPEVAAMRVTASIRTSQIPSFVEALNSALPVNVAREEDGRVHVTARR